MSSYTELKARQQAEANAFPLGFAFSNDQFTAMMQKWGLDPDLDLDKILSIGLGGYLRKSDKDAFAAMLRRHKAEQKEARAADRAGTAYLLEMFRYELANHEYCVTGDLTETLDALGLTMEDVNRNPAMKKALMQALQEYKTQTTC